MNSQGNNGNNGNNGNDGNINIENRIFSNSNEIKILKNEVKLNKLHTEGEVKRILQFYN